MFDTDWVDCPWYENCLGSCKNCNIKGNPCYEGPVERNTSDGTSEVLHDILMEHWFNVPT